MCDEIFHIVIPYLEKGELRVEIFEYKNYSKFIRVFNILENGGESQYKRMKKLDPLCKVKEGKLSDCWCNIKLSDILCREVFD
jgi:hypothetical protein